METAPRISLCVPTYNRAAFLGGCLESAIREAKAHPEGVVEILVSDNGSTDDTQSVVRAAQERYPPLRSLAFPENRGFDYNYLRCMEEARGEFVWIMGDDDLWLPGSVARIFQELDAGADAVLCGAMECDLDLRPIQARCWFRNPEGPRCWKLQTREDLAGYLDALRYEAGIFAFISVSVIRRERFLEGRERFIVGITRGFMHLWGMMVFLLSPATLRWVPETLIQNRVGNDEWAVTDPYARMMHDLRTWVDLADRILPEDDRLRGAFMGVLRQNQQNALVANLRAYSGDDPGKWADARRHLLAVQYDPLLVETVAYAHELATLKLAPPPDLDPAGLCLADLPLVARGARRVAVVALGGLEGLLGVAGLLASLREHRPGASIRVVCEPGLSSLLDGLEVQEVEPGAFQNNRSYQSQAMGQLRTFRPELVINGDRARRLGGDLLVHAAKAVAALGFEGPPQGADAKLALFLDRGYHGAARRDGGPGVLEAHLGLPSTAPRLWPLEASRIQAREILSSAGWESDRLLAVLGDLDDELADPAFQAKLQTVAREGWKVVGLGVEGAVPLLEEALHPLGDQALNLGGRLDLGGMLALLGHCQAHIGGTAPFQALAGVRADADQARVDIP